MATRAQNWIEKFQADNLSVSRWVNWGTTHCVVKNGRLEITTDTGANYYGIDCQDLLDLTGSNVSIEVLAVGDQGLTSAEVVPIQLEVDANNILFFLIAGNLLYAFKKVAGSSTNLASVAFSLSATKYVRIREEGGTTYWEYSPDRSTWTTLWSEANPITVTGLTLVILHGHWQAEANGGVAAFDNLNVLGNGTPGNLDPTLRVGDGMSATGRVK